MKGVALMRLNEKILYYRKAAKLSQEELAARVGVSRQAVSKWELGDATPEVDKLLALARAFGVATDELLSESEPAGPDRETDPPQEGQPAYTAPGTPPGDGFDRAAGRVGRLIRRFGWLVGVYVALSGLGVTAAGALVRWISGTMFASSNPMLGSPDALGGFLYGGTHHAVSEWDMAQWEMLNNSPAVVGQRIFQGFATAILAIGVTMMIVGAVLAVALYRKGNMKP